MIEEELRSGKEQSSGACGGRNFYDFEAVARIRQWAGMASWMWSIHVSVEVATGSAKDGKRAAVTETLQDIALFNKYEQS